MPAGDPTIKDRGKKFSSEYQPPRENVGRPKNVFKRFHEMFECSAADFAAVLTELFSLTIPELRKIIKDSESPAIRSCIAAAVLKDLENGSLYATEFLAERLFGKAVQKTEQAITINADDEAVSSVLKKHGVSSAD